MVPPLLLSHNFVSGELMEVVLYLEIIFEFQSSENIFLYSLMVECHVKHPWTTRIFHLHFTAKLYCRWNLESIYMRWTSTLIQTQRKLKTSCGWVVSWPSQGYLLLYFCLCLCWSSWITWWEINDPSLFSTIRMTKTRKHAHKNI